MQVPTRLPCSQGECHTTLHETSDRLMTMDLTDRRDAIRTVLADPPLVHRQEQGVWSTEESAYDLMASHAAPETRSLETGLGVSTVLFAIWGTSHTCIVPSQNEVDNCRNYLDERGISHERMNFIVASSTDVLPSMKGEIDLFLIDGCHGWPAPIIDWFYGAALLRQGGILLLDDTNLTSVSLGLVTFLRNDPRWSAVRRTAKWSAYRREGTGSLTEEFSSQPFLRTSPLDRLASIVPEPVRPTVGRIGRKLRIL